MVTYPQPVERVAHYFTKFAGIGNKTAERYVFDLITRWDAQAIRGFADALIELSRGVLLCPSCNIHIEKVPCPFCSEERRKPGLLCLTSSSREVYSVERTGLFTGTYFVTGSLSSPWDQRGIPESLVTTIRNRVIDEGVREIIFAFDSSVEGDATVSLLIHELSSLEVTMSRLASGIPVGAPLEFVDRGTLSRAFSHRQTVPREKNVSS